MVICLNAWTLSASSVRFIVKLWLVLSYSIIRMSYSRYHTIAIEITLTTTDLPMTYIYIHVLSQSPPLHIYKYTHTYIYTHTYRVKRVLGWQPWVCADVMMCDVSLFCLLSILSACMSVCLSISLSVCMSLYLYTQVQYNHTN